MIKILRVVCLLSILIFIFLGIYGSNKFINMNYDIEMKNPSYSIYAYEDYTLIETKLMGVIIDDMKVTSIDDLINESKLILKIAVENKSTAGYGIINNCKVKEVYKGNYKVNEHILIYDYVGYRLDTSASYFEGSKPLNKNNEYVVFLKDAPAPNVEDTYILSSINFGSFPINKTNQYLTNYESGSLKLSETYKYDYINQKGTFIDKYKILAEEVEEYTKQ